MLLLQIIREQYDVTQRQVLDEVGLRLVDVAGDGRCDSPGHSALYGMYSLMDVSTKKILCLHVLKVRSKYKLKKIEKQ